MCNLIKTLRVIIKWAHLLAHLLFFKNIANSLYFERKYEQISPDMTLFPPQKIVESKYKDPYLHESSQV